MEAFAWPSAVLIFAVVFVFVFRAQIGRFVDRTKSVGTGGFHAYDDVPQQQVPTKPDALGQFLESFHSPFLLETEAQLDEEIKKRGLTNLPDANKALRKSLAGTLILLQFEKTYNLIWSSQMAALIFLNGRAETPTPRPEVERFFSAAAAEYPKLYEEYTFQDWLAFLIGQVLVLEAKDGLTITVRGREFLRWRVSEGRSGPYYG